MKRAFLFFVGAFTFICSNAQQKIISQKSPDLNERKVLVYTTADKTELRLSKTADLSFQPFIQSPERPLTICFGGKNNSMLFITTGTSLYCVGVTKNK